MTKSKELLEEEERAFRNPQVEFEGQENLTVQTGNKTIPQMIADFERAGRAIMVARADQAPPEMPGLPAYPDPIEAKILAEEVRGDLMLARAKIAEDQEKARKDAAQRAEKNEQELERYREYERKQNSQQPAPQGTPQE